VRSDLQLGVGNSQIEDLIGNKDEFNRALKTSRPPPDDPRALVRRTVRPDILEDDMKKRQIVARAAGVIVTVGALLGAGNAAQAQEQSRVMDPKRRSAR